MHISNSIKKILGLSTEPASSTTSRSASRPRTNGSTRSSDILTSNKGSPKIAQQATGANTKGLAEPHSLGALGQERERDLGKRLHAAAARGDALAVRSLILIGAPVNFRTDDPHHPTPLFAAVQEGNLDCIKILLEYRARLEDREEESNWTPLMLAVVIFDARAAALLINAGANPDAVCYKGNTPRRDAQRIASAYNRTDVLKVFENVPVGGYSAKRQATSS